MLAVTCRSCPHFFLFFVCNYSSVLHVSSTKCGVVIHFSPTTPCGHFRARNTHFIRQFDFWQEFAKCTNNSKVTPHSKPCVKKTSCVLKIHWSWSITLKLALQARAAVGTKILTSKIFVAKFTSNTFPFIGMWGKGYLWSQRFLGAVYFCKST